MTGSRITSLEDQFNLVSLSSDERELLKTLYICYAGQLFDETQLMRHRRMGCSGAEHMILFLSLRKKNSICAMMRSWGERMYYIPKENLPRLHHAFMEHSPHDVIEPVRILMEAKTGLVLDLLQVLSYISQGHFLISSKGCIHKKSIQRLNERVHLRSEDLAQLSISLRHAEDTPVHIAFLVDLLDGLKLVEIEGKHMKLQETQLFRWLSMSTEQMTSILVKSVLDRYGSSDANMEHLYCLISQPDLLSGQWIDIQFLMEECVDQQLLKRSQIEAMTERIKTWVTAFAGWGWMDVGMSVDHRICFRWTLPSSQIRNVLYENHLSSSMTSAVDVSMRKLYVQPEFDIIVLPDVPHTLRFTLSLFTSLQMNDHTSIYKLTEDCVLQALQRGITIEEIISFMTFNCEGELPAHVLLTLRKWAEHAKDNRCVTNAPKWHRYFTAKKYDEDKVLDDYAMFMKELHLDVDRQEEQSPSLPLSYTNLQQIPNRWKEDFRSYHSSTAKQIIQQALDWQTKVQLSVNGIRVEFIPLNISNSCDIISGEIYNHTINRYEKVELTCHDWQEMRIIVPVFVE
ncbi:hypothetical protein [Paenibacillus sp. CMAA1364]